MKHLAQLEDTIGSGHSETCVHETDEEALRWAKERGDHIDSQVPALVIEPNETLEHFTEIQEAITAFLIDLPHVSQPGELKFDSLLQEA